MLIPASGPFCLLKENLIFLYLILFHPSYIISAVSFPGKSPHDQYIDTSYGRAKAESKSALLFTVYEGIDCGTVYNNYIWSSDRCYFSILDCMFPEDDHVSFTFLPKAHQTIWHLEFSKILHYVICHIFICLFLNS